MKRTEIFVLLLILVIAVGLRVPGLDRIPPGLYSDEALAGTGLFAKASTNLFGHTAFAVRIVSAIVGILTVLGAYLLASRMFDKWELAAISAFLVATGFWHVLFSRIGLTVILAPALAVWGWYFLYRGLETPRIWPWIAAGALFGFGTRTMASMWAMPAIIALVIVAYLYAMRRNFSRDNYAHTRGQLVGSIALMVSVMLIAFLVTPTRVLPAYGFIDFAGQPLMILPLTVFLALGLARSAYKVMRTWYAHGHPPVIHVLLLSWFAIGMATNPPYPLMVAPAAYLLAGHGIWWMYVWGLHWYRQRDVHQLCLPGPHGHRRCAGEGTVVVTVALIAFLAAIGIADGVRYFTQWGNSAETRAATNQRAVETSARLNALPPSVLKFVIMSSISEATKVVVYLTDTDTIEKQNAKNIYYLTAEQFKRHRYPSGAIVVRLDP